MISHENVEDACSAVSEYSEEQMAMEFERFFKSQPNLCDFVVELTTDSDQKIQELSLFLSYMIFKVVESAQGEGMLPVSPETIDLAFRESEGWIEKINQAETSAVRGPMLSSLANDTEPHLLQYVISEINQPLEDGEQLGDEQKGEVFFVLRTVISSLSRKPLITGAE